MPNAKLLGTQFKNTLSFAEHVSTVLMTCSQRVYLLKLLRDQGMPRDCLNCVFQSPILSRIEYALPVWGGYLNVEQTGQINSFYADVLSTFFCEDVINLEQVLEKSDRRMFSVIQNPEHGTHTLLPPRKETDVFRPKKVR